MLSPRFLVVATKDQVRLNEITIPCNYNACSTKYSSTLRGRKSYSSNIFIETNSSFKLMIFLWVVNGPNENRLKSTEHKTKIVHIRHWEDILKVSCTFNLTLSWRRPLSYGNQSNQWTGFHMITGSVMKELISASRGGGGEGWKIYSELSFLYL